MRDFGSMTNRQAASLFGTKQFICIHSLYGYYRALMANDGFHVYLPLDSSNETLGAAILAALDKSRAVDPSDEFFEGVRIYATYRAWIKEAMSMYNFRSKSQMFRSLAYCRIDREGGTIWIEPHQHRGSDRCDDLDDDQLVQIPATFEAAAVGAAGRLAMNRCI